MSNFFYEKDINIITLVEGKNYRRIKAHNENIMLVEVYFENGGIGEPHKHIHEQACYCLEGEFEFTIGDEIKTIGVGDTVYIPSNIEHGCRVLSKNGRLLDIFTPQREDFIEKDDKKYYIIDRFEGDIAVLMELDGDKCIDVEKEKLMETNEGMVVSESNGKFYIEKDKTEERKARIKRKFDNLWK